TGLGAASAAGPGSAGPAARAGPRWAWPLAPQPVVRRGFDDVGRYEAGHRGVDLVASAGAPVLAPTAARVVFAGPVAGRGVLVLLHPDGLRSSYEPVVDAAAVGTLVLAGQTVARVAAAPAHCGATACLHVGVRRGEDYLDPLLLLAPADPPVLLPLGRPG
ncbi:peptidoglycan DD-metalloendopeptidase family protein, partial [Kineococcus sp. R8]|uniref:murein hydrolase activator EnvC family protein n=1 Tax=Kineococcus siccus TaxID=2696567 RepID=UPI00141222BC